MVMDTCRQVPWAGLPTVHMHPREMDQINCWVHTYIRQESPPSSLHHNPPPPRHLRRPSKQHLQSFPSRPLPLHHTQRPRIPPSGRPQENQLMRRSQTAQLTPLVSPPSALSTIWMQRSPKQVPLHAQLTASGTSWTQAKRMHAMPCSMAKSFSSLPCTPVQTLIPNLILQSSRPGRRIRTRRARGLAVPIFPVQTLLSIFPRQ